ncbi:hypothetical protein V6R21_25010 [Limibacter armeniacum]|uniref:hypothetical protein n=1 Tax=Limibacter armeniacum TaxID=466084 RepID=UPI002FE6AE19
MRIIDNEGKIVHASTLQVAGIHGNASDGQAVLFGFASGILVVEASGEQHLIEYPASFGTAWIGSIFYAKGADKFIGYTASKGAYIIDIDNNQLTPIFETAELLDCVKDMKGESVILTERNGTLSHYNLMAGTLIQQKNAFDAIAADTKNNVSVKASSRYIYLL